MILTPNLFNFQFILQLRTLPLDALKLTEQLLPTTNSLSQLPPQTTALLVQLLQPDKERGVLGLQRLEEEGGRALTNSHHGF